MPSNWKTTTLGVLTIIAGAVNAGIALLNGHSVDWSVLVAAITAGWGLIHASDAKPSAVSPAVTKLGVILLMLLLPVSVLSQSASTGTTTTTANTPGLSAWGGPLTAYINGSWVPAADSGEGWDAYDWGTPAAGSTTKPYHLLAIAHQLNVPGQFDIYSGGLGVNASLANLFKNLNAPPGKFGIVGSVTAGNGMPASGSGSHFSMLADFGLRFQASGSVTWTLVKGGVALFGSSKYPYITTNAQYFF